MERKIKHVKTEVSSLRGRIKPIQSYFYAEKSFVNFLYTVFCKAGRNAKICKEVQILRWK